MTDYKSMFEQAVRTLAAIDEALGIGDDGCGDPDQTLTAIAELKAAKVGAGRTATVTRKMIGAAHDVMLAKGDFVLSAALLERIYLAMDAVRHNAKGTGRPLADGPVDRRVVRQKDSE